MPIWLTVVLAIWLICSIVIAVTMCDKESFSRLTRWKDFLWIIGGPMSIIIGLIIVIVFVVAIVKTESQ